MKVVEPEAQFTPTNIPMTLGTLVEQLIHQFFIYKSFENNKSIRMAIAKQGIINMGGKQASVVQECLESLDICDSLAELEAMEQNSPELHRKLNKGLSQSEGQAPLAPPYGGGKTRCDL
jgi:hypothetical protein